jgi:formate dehydrogenase major subunit
VAGPRPGAPAVAEFCANGAKAVAEEATQGPGHPESFAGHSIADLDRHSEMWLGQQGRITHPMVKRPDGTHYEPIGWDEAFASNMCHESTLGRAAGVDRDRQGQRHPR